MKKLIIISSDEYVRNYIGTGSFSEIDDDCYYLADKGIKLSEALEDKSNFIGYISVSPKNEELYHKLFQTYMWRYRDRSSAFYFRFYRQRIYVPKNIKYRSIKTILGWFKSWKLLLSSTILTHKFTVSWIESKLVDNKELERKIDNVSPELIIFPNSAYNSLGYDLLRIAEKRMVKTLFLVDNWDNLSSKTVFWKKPDYLGVWGQQSKEHAITIHNFSENQIKNIGTPRFQQYFDLSHENIPSHFSFPYILFCGSFLGFDELSALKEIDLVVEKNQNIFGGYKIVYRPHPWRSPRECNDEFSESDFNHVILDPQLINYHCIDNKLSFQPALDYYPALLKNASFVVGPLTTMLIEALVCGTKVLALRYDDTVHISSPHNAYKYYPHFRGINAIEGLEFCDDMHDLKREIIKMFKLKSKPVPDMHESLKYFIYHDGCSYSVRLRKLVDGCVQ